jgi:hypothetical protein
MEDNKEITAALLKAEIKEDFYKYMKKTNTSAITGREVHLGLAKKFEDFGDIKNALTEYNLAVRDGCKDIKIFEKISEYYCDLGKLKNAARFLERIVDENPGNFEIAVKLAAIYEEQELLDKSKDLYDRLFKQTGDKRFRQQLNYIETNYFEKQEEVEPGKISDETLLKFVDLFPGREGVYARQWINEKNETGYSPVREHFSPKVAKNHLMGNITVGSYQLRIDGTLMWAAFDIDLNKKYREKMQADKKNIDNESILKTVFNTAKEIHFILKRLSIPSIIEFSGFKGYHVWLFFQSPLPAFQVKIFMNGILKQAAFDSEKIDVEIFPKQVKLKENGLGNLVKLPLGIHKRTNKFSFFVDENGEKIDNQFEFLGRIKKIEKDVFLEKIKSVRHIDKTENKKESAKNETTPVEKEKTGEFDPYTSVEFNYLAKKCQVLSYLIDKLFKTNQLNNDEKVTIKYSFGHLEHGVDIVNYLLEQIPGIKDSELLKSKFSGNPISCPKIRKRLNEVTLYLDCDCDFGELSTYPTPLLHLRDLHHAVNNPLRAQEAHAIKFQDTLRQYLKIKEEMNERAIFLRELERSFNRYFDDQGVDEVKTSFGIIKRMFHPNGESEFIIKL